MGDVHDRRSAAEEVGNNRRIRLAPQVKHVRRSLRQVRIAIPIEEVYCSAAAVVCAESL